MHTNRYDNWVKSKLGAESKEIANRLNPLDQIIQTAIKYSEQEVGLSRTLFFYEIIEEAVYKAYGQAIADMATEIQTVTNKLIERTTE